MSSHHHPEHVHRAGHQGSVPGDILDLDAEVLGEVNADIVASLTPAEPPRRILDLGCGTGAGTFALLDRFPDARVTAVDASLEHLERLRVRAEGRGAQVDTVLLDLDATDWPPLGRFDLVWASASLHHLDDPDRALRRVRALIAPDGHIVVVELAGFPRFLPDDAPADRPGLEARCHRATTDRHAAHLPHRGADWGPKLSAAGFTVASERSIAVHVAASDHPGVGAYASAALRQLRQSADGVLPAADLDALDRLLDVDGPDGILRRPDLAVRTERTVWTARPSEP